MTAQLFGIGKRGAFSLIIGSLRGQCRGSYKYPSCFVPTAAFSTSSGDEEGRELKEKVKKLRSKDKLIVFVNVPSLPSLESEKTRTPVGFLDGEKRSRSKNDKSKQTPKNNSDEGSTDPEGQKMKKKKRVRKSGSANDASVADEHLPQEKKKKQVRRSKDADKSTTVGGDVDNTPETDEQPPQKKKKKQSKKSKNADKSTTVDRGVDNTPPETEPKKKRVRKKKVIEQSDEEIKSLLLGSFVPFEGTPVDNFNDECLENNSFSMDRQDLPEGRFYHLKSSTGSYSFPSVTTILDNTMEGSSYYRLLKWKLKLTGEHGAKGFDTIRKSTLNSGHSFHKELESRLQKLQSQQEGANPVIKTTSSVVSASAADKISSVKSKLQEGVSKDPVSDNSVTPQPVIQDEITRKSEERDKVDASESSLSSSTDVVASDPTGDSDETRLEGLSVSLSAETSDPDPTGAGGEVGLEDEEYSKVTPGDEDEHRSLADFLPSSDPKYMQSVQHVLAEIGKIKALETSIAHLQLGYMGTFDCLAEYKGTLCLIDWKTSNKPKPTLADCYDYPLQAVAYAGAINQDPHMNLKVLNVLIVIAYGSGEPAHAHLINSDLCQKYWLKWLQRLQKYQTQFSEDLSEIIN